MNILTFCAICFLFIPCTVIRANTDTSNALSTISLPDDITVFRMRFVVSYCGRHRFGPHKQKELVMKINDAINEVNLSFIDGANSMFSPVILWMNEQMANAIDPQFCAKICNIRELHRLIKEYKISQGLGTNSTFEIYLTPCDDVSKLSYSEDVVLCRPSALSVVNWKHLMKKSVSLEILHHFGLKDSRYQTFKLRIHSKSVQLTQEDVIDIRSEISTAVINGPACIVKGDKDVQRSCLGNLAIGHLWLRIQMIVSDCGRGVLNSVQKEAFRREIKKIVDAVNKELNEHFDAELRVKVHYLTAFESRSIHPALCNYSCDPTETFKYTTKYYGDIDMPSSEKYLFRIFLIKCYDQKIIGFTKPKAHICQKNSMVIMNEHSEAPKMLFLSVLEKLGLPEHSYHSNVKNIRSKNLLLGPVDIQSVCRGITKLFKRDECKEGIEEEQKTITTVTDKIGDNDGGWKDFLIRHGVDLDNQKHCKLKREEEKLVLNILTELCEDDQQSFDEVVIQRIQMDLGVELEDLGVEVKIVLRRIGISHPHYHNLYHFHHF